MVGRLANPFLMVFAPVLWAVVIQEFTLLFALFVEACFLVTKI